MRCVFATGMFAWFAGLALSGLFAEKQRLQYVEAQMKAGTLAAVQQAERESFAATLPFCATCPEEN